MCFLLFFQTKGLVTAAEYFAPRYLSETFYNVMKKLSKNGVADFPILYCWGYVLACENDHLIRENAKKVEFLCKTL